MTEGTRSSTAAAKLHQFGDFLAGLARDAWDTFTGWPLWRQVTALMLVAAMATAAVVVDPPSPSTLRVWAMSLGPGFPLAFIVLYIAATQLPIPRTLFTLSSGLLFGPWTGVAVAMSATVVSAAVSFTLVRALGREWMAPRLTHPAVAGIDARLRRRGWFAVGSLRLIAAVPFSVLNYASAVSSIRVLPFLAGTAVGAAPGTIAIVMLGDALTGQVRPENIAVSVVLLAVGLVGLLVDATLPQRGDTSPVKPAV